MRKLLLYLGRGIGAWLVPLAVLSMVVNILFSSVVPAISNPDNLKRGFAKQDIYRDTVPIILPAILNQSNSAVNENLLLFIEKIQRSLSPDDWRAVTNELIPPDWVQSQVETVIDGIYTYLEGDTSMTGIVYEVDVDLLVANLESGPSDRVITRIVTLAKPCTPSEETQISAIGEGNLPDNVEDIPVCSPSEQANSAIMTSLLRRIFDRFADSIQTQASIATTTEIGDIAIEERVNQGGETNLDITIDGRREALVAARLFYQTYELYIPIFQLLSVALVALIIALAVRSFKGFTRWLGWINLLAAVSLLSIQLAISIDLIDVPRPQPNGNAPIELLEMQTRITNGILSAAYAEFTEPILSEATQLFGSGLVLLTISIFIPKPKATHRVQTDSSAALPT